MKIPILTYHSIHIHGNAYAENDLVALASDLETVAAKGFRILPLRDIVSAWLRSPDAFADERVVAFTCDDGGDFDFHDLPHPTAGTQRSVLNLLRDFRGRHPGIRPHVTSFVIVSPDARRELDRTCMIGRGWWNDAWWPEAAASGLMDIANHSWDHNHETLPERFSHGVARGTFRTIDTRALADAQIARACEFLRAHAPNPGDALFAYPYGEWNDYLAGEYFPRFANALGITAAFSDAAGYLAPDSPRWALPRFVFGRDWKSPAGLEAILEAVA
jgi:peptidoglycan/xylan/chitin deacetylase (PgdA/CDA1 family)